MIIVEFDDMCSWDESRANRGIDVRKVDSREEIADKLLLGYGLLISIGMFFNPLDDFYLNFGILSSHLN